MARTTQVIYQQMLDEKAKYSSLNGLTNTSSTAIWRTIMYCVAVVIASFEQLQDVFKAELLATAEDLPVGTKQWYADKMLDYQEGYPLIYNRATGSIEYEVVDDTSKIIVASTCVNEADTVVIKVAKSDGANGLEELSAEQITSVNSYINDFKFAGTITRLISLPGDLLKLSVSVIIDKTKINTDGQSVSDTDVYPVEDSIVNYLLDFAQNDFAGEFLLINLIDAIQQTDGVINVNVSYCQAKPSSGVDYIDVLSTEFKTYQPTSGYLLVDPSHPLNSNIIYS